MDQYLQYGIIITQMFLPFIYVCIGWYFGAYDKIMQHKKEKDISDRTFRKYTFDKKIKVTNNGNQRTNPR